MSDLTGLLQASIDMTTQRTDAQTGLKEKPVETVSLEPAVFEILPDIELSFSPTFAKLVEALAKAQLAYKPVLKQNENEAFTRGARKSFYADLATYIDATQEALATNGLVVIQWPTVAPESKSMTLITMLAHSSGEWMKGKLTLPATNRDGFTAQSCGSSITYARRYSYSAVTGTAAEDDDGNAASGRGSTEAAKAVGEEKAENLKKSAKNGPPYVPSLFYAWPPSHNGNTAFVSGDKELLSRFKEMLAAKGKWSNAQNAFLVPAESFDDVKFVIEEAAVPFKKLES